LVKEVLKARGFSDEEINNVLEQGLSLLEELKDSKKINVAKEVEPLIDKILGQQVEKDKGLEDLSKSLEEIVEKQVKIKHKKLKEEKDRLSEYYWKSNKVMDNINNGVVILDSLARIIFINNKAKEFFGFEEGHILDKAFMEDVVNWIENKNPASLISAHKDKVVSIKDIIKDSQGNISSIIID